MPERWLRQVQMLSVRRRIALWCIGLSTIVYVIPTMFGFYFFYFSLTGALDHELTSLASSLGHAIDLESEKPRFRDWARVVQTSPPRSLTTILLYDAQGHLLDRYGTPGIERLILDQREVSEAGRTMRFRVTPLISNRGHLIGYLQFEIPTKERDAAVRQYALVLAVIAPAILFGLGVCSLLVADRAMVPIQQTIDVLRQFISDAGHELNTPLSIINACHEALEHKLARRPQRSQEEPALKELKIIGDSSDRMQKIIDGLMLLAELENPLARPITLEILDIDQLLRQCTRDFQIKFEHEGRTLEYQSSGENPVLGDKQALSQLLSNLLENALRYTEPGGKVTVSLKRRDAGLQISVADDGIGIPQECLPRVFDRFYRVDKSRSRNSGGSGLGLSIVKAIAEAHRGTVKVESKTGVGTEFTLNLPLPTAGHND